MPQPRIDWLERLAHAKDQGVSDIEFAAQVWRDRQMKKPALGSKFRQFAPIGFWVDRAGGKKNGIWYPHPDEVRACCRGMGHMASLKYPWHYQRHCRTIRHVAMLFDLDERHLRKYLGKQHGQGQMRCVSCNRFVRSFLDKCGPCMAKERLDKAA